MGQNSRVFVSFVHSRSYCFRPVLWIRNFCLDLDPELKFKIRSQQKVKEHIL